MAIRPGQKTVLITGCTPGGIGHALAIAFATRGLHVIATARNVSVLAGLAAEGMTTLALDVTNADSIKTCHDEVSRLTGGRLDMLVNNAGRTHTHPATDIDMDDVRQTFETNVFGVMAMCASFADLLIASKGLIINIASLAAITPYVFGSVYCASKGAVVSYSRTLRLELKPFGVRVMVAMAGTVRSNIASKTHRQLPEDSIYQRVKDVFVRRLTFSQTNATVTTEEFAEKLVSSALRSEAPVMFRSWFGRPDWFWAGGFSRPAWVASFSGEWVFDVFMYRLVGINRLEHLLRQEAAGQRKIE